MPTPSSPFHAGERAAQSRIGKRAAMQAVGNIAIRSFMPDQHRQFFEQLPFIVAGSVDEHGWPWASILTGGAGFIASPDDRHLDLSAKPLPDDPLSQSLKPGAPIGLLGIELATRRRNRMNANVTTIDDTGLHLRVAQSFGNCPQYIQTRDIRFVRDPNKIPTPTNSDRFTTFDSQISDYIAQTDTFFVSSYVTPRDNPTAEGVDVSHRGGRNGFVKVDGDTLTIPDYAGNNFFNTLGNFLVNPKAGLLFPDFTTGDVLMLTGTVEILWDDHPDIAGFKGAERGWRFTLSHGIRIRDALPFRADFGAFSPNSLMADDWTTSKARKTAQAQRAKWRPMQVTALHDESREIRSFSLAPTYDLPLLGFNAGQFLTLRVAPDGAAPLTRTYTVSSAPGDAIYRISVKREPGGIVSNHLHDTVVVGDILDVKPPNGAFHLDALEKRPAVLIAGGVGITPMIAMTRHVMNETVRKRYTRPLTIFHAAHSVEQRGFADEFRAAMAAHTGKIRYLSVISTANDGDTFDTDYDVAGRITPDLLRQTLAYDDYDFYLCGPASFMQSIYDMLRGLGAPDDRIFAESFGPAALVRSSPDRPVSPVEADTAVITFHTSGFEHVWTKGDATLLETAEAHGLSPAFSCRTGSCGSCLTRKRAGTVTYRTPVTADHTDDDVLLCCAVPAAGTQEVILDL
jgi:ferredoxin-NADP reductase/predicted pyridoxine 5'-phosphate oxidase superfamily flavin-nucleotide-binding protein